MKKNKKPLTLLEVMIVIAIVAIAGGGLFWRLGHLIEAKRKQSDVALVQNVLLASRMLAINTKSDWELQIQPQEEGWILQLVDLEDAGKSFGCGKLSDIPVRFGTEEVPGKRLVAIRFFSSGQVAPFGSLELAKEKIKIPEFFHLVEGEGLGPIHPDDL